MRTNALNAMCWLAAGVLAAAASPGRADTAAISGKVTGTKKFLRNTVVYVEKALGAHVGTKARIDQKNQTFVPFVLPVVVGTTVEFFNDDATDHNVYSPDNEKYDLGVGNKGAVLRHVFDKTGAYAQMCKLHPSMLAYVVVLQNPFFAVTDDEGRFEIKNVPPGDYQVAVWNERRRAQPVPVKVGAGGQAGVEIALVPPGKATP